MTKLLATKGSIKKAYIGTLQNLYPSFYNEGSDAHHKAHWEADKALAGRMKLKGYAWSTALKMHGLNDSTTMQTLSELPE